MEDPATTVTPSLWASLNSWFTSTVFFVLLNLMIATIVFTSNLPNNNNNQQDHEEQQKRNSNNDNRNQPQIARSPSILHRIKSFNFYPQRFQHELPPSEIHNHQQQPLEVAATQYVFNQPLEYQHFDYDFDSTSSDQLASAGKFSSTNQTYEIQSPETESPTVHSDLDPARDETDRDTGFEYAYEEHITNEFQSLDEVYSKLKGAVHVDRTKSDGELPPKPAAKMKKSASMKVSFAHLEEEEITEARRPATVRAKKAAVHVEEEEDDDDAEVDARAGDFINKFRNNLQLQRIESILRTTKAAAGKGTDK